MENYHFYGGGEHCVECAMPLCYASCKMYVPRIDGRCLRFEDGVQPVIFDDYRMTGAYIRIKIWGKLEAILPKRHIYGLVAIAKELNINIDTFAVIDDSKFERMEISQTLPQVRVYNAKEIYNLISLPEFDVSVTEESSKRRIAYQVDATRKTIKAS